MWQRFSVNPKAAFMVFAWFGLVMIASDAAAGQTQAKPASSTSSLRLPHIPNPIEVIGSGAKKVTNAVGSLLPGKKQEATSSRYYPPQGSKKAPEKKGLLGWMKPKTEPKKSESVCDWIGKEPLLP